MGYNAVGCEFSGNESIIWYIQKEVEEIHWSVHEVIPQRVNIATVMCDESMERLKAKFVDSWMMTDKKV